MATRSEVPNSQCSLTLHLVSRSAPKMHSENVSGLMSNDLPSTTSGLLWHEESTTSKPDAYKPLGRFFTGSGDDEKPSLINSEEKKNLGAFQQREPPFGTDNMSAWERDDSSSNAKEKNNNVHYSQMEKLQPSDQYYETSKFKRIVYDKNPAPVDMSKLLSFGYANENKPIDNSDLSD
ncbi:uncharacterized protein C7orf57 homolog isoform X2 [Etheostoma spectabile]|uniref:uncharacterized protein C7orf57 homolog isoform X2 n=1 Tax=Etheostoma spectabile TaxID=54343 RepID=UPI0013AEBC30|nr:uncharacterized protein LOC116698074 isoform X2 [Etheostoma spectabile]